MTTPRQVLDSTITEKDFLKQIIDLAHLRGWRIAHFRPAMTERGWRTAVQADGVGWPDLFLVHEEKHRVLALEVKREKGKLSEAQSDWLKALQAGGILACVVRPSDWEKIVRCLE